jgi:hypothetical protein
VASGVKLVSALGSAPVGATMRATWPRADSVVTPSSVSAAVSDSSTSVDAMSRCSVPT